VRPEGCLGGDEGFHFGISRSASAAEVRLESALCKPRDVDLASPEFLGEESGQHLGRRFGGPIDGVTRETRRVPVPLEIVTMRPPSAIMGSSFWVKKATPLKWMLKRLVEQLPPKSSQRCIGPMPALFTSPNSCWCLIWPELTSASADSNALNESTSPVSNCSARALRPGAQYLDETREAAACLSLIVINDIKNQPWPG